MASPTGVTEISLILPAEHGGRGEVGGHRPAVDRGLGPGRHGYSPQVSFLSGQVHNTPTAAGTDSWNADGEGKLWRRRVIVFRWKCCKLGRRRSDTLR